MRERESMGKRFNVNAVCRPDMHYMVNLESRLAEIKGMVDRGDYFAINRARQYGKTTILKALEPYLQRDYTVLSLDFQGLSQGDFERETYFVKAFARELCRKPGLEKAMPDAIRGELRELASAIWPEWRMADLFLVLERWCGEAGKPLVLVIDEVDSAANNQVFLDFLAQLRRHYIDRGELPALQSVILAGVYDIRNLKRKFVAGDGHKTNSPWNIAADFLVEMGFSPEDIAGMLREYEGDYHTGMDVGEIARMIYEYTSGYPFLVSRLCQILEEKVAAEAAGGRKSAWTEEGLRLAVKILLQEKNALFESLTGKLNDYPDISDAIYRLLFQGQRILYHPDDPSTDMALMFGFVKVEDGFVAVANRIFETRLYNGFLALPKMQESGVYKAALLERNRFVHDGRLDMELILESFASCFRDIFGDRSETFLEEDGRKYFLLYLKPIINGTGNYYIEARTRSGERTDVIVDYSGEQFIVEMKIWRGNAYHIRGEEQLAGYLDQYRLKKGYMVSFCFNKNKKTGLQKIIVGDRILVEVVV